MIRKGGRAIPIANTSLWFLYYAGCEYLCPIIYKKLGLGPWSLLRGNGSWLLNKQTKWTVLFLSFSAPGFYSIFTTASASTLEWTPFQVLTNNHGPSCLKLQWSSKTWESLIVTFLQMCQKCPKTKNNGQIWKSTIKLVLKSFPTFSENYLMNFIFV